MTKPAAPESADAQRSAVLLVVSCRESKGDQGRGDGKLCISSARAAEPPDMRSQGRVSHAQKLGAYQEQFCSPSTL